MSGRVAREAVPVEASPELLLAAQRLAARAPPRSAVGNLALGTAGWTDKSLILCKRFYPRGTSSPMARLRHYATQFRLVEVDATFYTLLDPAVTARWVEWTDPEFVFNIKSHPVLTGHPVDIARAPRDLAQELERIAGDRRRFYPHEAPHEIRAELTRRFLAQLTPLADAGRLGCVMLQFPPWFHATRGNARALEALRETLGELPASVEFRHPSWLAAGRRERVFDLLRAQRFSYVVVDEPDVPTGGVPCTLAVTNPDLALLRFHGQNAAGWGRGASVWQRFNYVYSAAELRGWLPRVSELRSRATRVHAVFNNCVRDYAVLGAKGLAGLAAGQAEQAQGVDDARPLPDGLRPGPPLED